MKGATFFFLLAVIVIAPHLDTPTAGGASFACLALALLFWLLEPPR